MKSRTLACIAAVTVFAVPLIQLRLVAQNNQVHNDGQKHHHYKLIDIGTFGGPNSYFTFVSQTLNRHGAATGSADTSEVLNPPFCLIDCFVTHAFEWKDGIMTDLGALPGIGASFPNDINDRGVVAGISLNGGFDPALGLPYFDGIVVKDGEVIDLGTFGGPLSYSASISERDEVVGFALNSTPDSFDLGTLCQNFPMPTQMHAFIWRDGIMRDLGTLGGTDSCALFVNQRGQAAGVSFTDTIVNTNTGRPTIHPFVWDGKEMVDLGTLGGTIAVASAINDRGQVAGASTLPGDLAWDVFTWERGRLTDQGNLGGNFIEVVGFNEVGEVVGRALLPDQVTYHAFLVKEGVMMDLGTQGGNPCSYAVQINLKEQIVGYSDDCGGNNSRAFLWEKGLMTDLNAFVPSGSGVTLTQGISINDRGEITTQGVIPNGDQRGFLLTPCYEHHGDDQGCEEGGGENAVLPTNPAPPAEPRGTLPPSLRRRMSLYRFPGSAFGPKN